MAVRYPYFYCLAAAGVLLLPSAVRADIRIEERSTALESVVTRWTAIKGDRRAIVSRLETTGVIYNAGGRYGAYVEIARPDLDLIYEIDPQERSYREITQPQFSRLLQKGIQAPRDANDQPLRTLYNAQTTAIEVVPTGHTKRIAGYMAEQVLARVVVGAQNLVSGNQFRFTFDQEVWITKDEAILREVRPFEEAYTDAFGSAVNLSQARLLAGEWNDAFINHLRALNDRVRALQGFPLASTTTVTEESVAQSKEEKGTSRKAVVASSEVRRISLETVPEREFEVPGGFINADTKVAAAPAIPGPGGMDTMPAKPAIAQAAPVRTAAAPDPMKSAPVRVEGGGAGSPNVVTGAPTNVIVRGAPKNTAFTPKTTPIPVDGYTAPPPITPNYPVLALARPGSAPSLITVDEPEDNPFVPKKKGKKK